MAEIQESQNGLGKPSPDYSYRLVPEDPANMPKELPCISPAVCDRHLRHRRERSYQSYMPEEYKLPNDAYEQKRLNTLHALWRMILDGKLTAAPIEGPDNVLEIGAGTGAWAIEFAADHPLCNVLATDLSLSQIPDHLLSATNCEFVIENSETRDWASEDVFDYIHLRSMSSCFSDIRVIFQKAYESLKPGGWIEMQDVTWTPHTVDSTLGGSSLERWCKLVREAGVKSGRIVDKVKQCNRLMEEAGFVNVTEEIVPCPGGPWPKDSISKQMGILFSNAMLGLIESCRRFVLEAGLELMPDEVDDLASKAMDEIRETRVRWYSNVYFVYGQKPENVKL